MVGGGLYMVGGFIKTRRSEMGSEWIFNNNNNNNSSIYNSFHVSFIKMLAAQHKAQPQN